MTASAVVHLITNFAARGGAEIMLARLVNASPGRPARIISLRELSDDNQSLVTRGGVEFQALAATGPLDLIKASGTLARLLDSEQPAAVMCWMYHAHVVGALARRSAAWRGRLFWNVRSSLDPTAYLAPSTRLALLAGRALKRSADGIVFNSRRAADNHRRRGYGHRNTIVLPNGYRLPDAPDLSPRAPRTFGIAARFHPEKDYETFLACAGRVMEAMPQARLVIAGRGAVEANPDFAALLDRSRIDRARLVTMDELTDMSPFYQAIDVNVLSSRMEGFPNVIAEAMSHGVPCVSTDVGDAAYLIGEAGRRVPARDPVALAEKVLELMTMPPADHGRLRAAARARIAENFEIGNVAGRYEAFMFPEVA